MLSNEVVERLGELLAKATPGKWYTGHLCRDDHGCTCPFLYAEGQAGMGAIATVGTTDEDVRSLDEAKANQELIAAAVNALPELLRVYRLWLDAPRGKVIGQTADDYVSPPTGVIVATDKATAVKGHRIRLVRDGDSGEG